MDPDTPIHAAIFRVTDLETTGIDPQTDGICEVAFVDSAGGHFQALTNPRRPIPPEASAVHHLTDADVRGQETFADALGAVVGNVADETVFVAHNAAFEAGFFAAAGVDMEWLCTQRLAMHLVPGARSYANQYLRYALDLDVPAAQGLPAHRALADCHVTASLLEYLLPLAIESGCATVGDLVTLANQPVELQTITFGKHHGQSWSEVPTDYLQWMARKGDWDMDTTHTLRRELQRRAGNPAI